MPRNPVPYDRGPASVGTRRGVHRVRPVKCRRFNLQRSTCRVVGRATARSGGQKPQETNVREGSAPAR